MKPLQISIVILSLAGVISFFMLPKVVIENEKSSPDDKKMTSKPLKDNELSSDLTHTHTVKVKESDLNVLAGLKKQLAKASNTEKKLIFADSLSAYYHRLQQYDSAAHYREYAVELAPNEARWASTGDGYEEAFNFAEGETRKIYLEKAQLYYDKVLDQDPKNLEVKSKLAMTYVSGEQPMKGVGLLREVLKDDPNNQTAIFNLGILSVQSRQFEKALERFNDLIKINPQHAPAHFYRGVSYLSLGNKEQALADFKKAKSLEKDKEFNAIVDDYIHQAEAGN
ncbi:MAG TPA: tetratricopeptide repeat protein [Cytophagaceae bacterium]|jgi:tetratricopeptide (TPR) repeat protein|nr:tetratricopeptide repeat protein [Cytophagaceae bacterium]